MIATLFQSINDYAAMVESSGLTIQLIDIGLITITNAQMFTGGICKWNGKADTYRIWKKFKAHFSTAQKWIKLSQPQHTVSNFGFHQKSNADYITDKVIQHIDIQQSKETTSADTIASEHMEEQNISQQMGQMENPTQQDATVLV